MYIYIFRHLLFLVHDAELCGSAKPVNWLGELTAWTGRYGGLMAPTTITENIDIKCRGSDINCIDLAGPTARLTDKSWPRLAPLLGCPQRPIDKQFPEHGLHEGALERSCWPFSWHGHYALIAYALPII